MEGLAWLLMKMAVLLAVTGASFLALGWWLRGRQTDAASAPAVVDADSSSAPVSRPELVEKIENLRANLRTLETDRDTAKRQLAAAEAANEALRSEIEVLRGQLTGAEAEVRALCESAMAVTPPASSAVPAGESAGGPSADFSLRSEEQSAAPVSPPEKEKKPKAPRKPRAKKR